MSGVKYKARYDFTATQSGTLSFKAGDVFVFVSKTTEDWWSVKTPNGQMGLVPATYLDELKEPSAAAKESVPVIYKALYDYTGVNSSQLTFKQGDTMVLVDMPSTGWWSMRHTGSGKQGLVPTNYVEKATSNGTPAHGNGGGDGEPNLKDENVLAEVLLSIDRAIEAIYVETTRAGGVVSAHQRAALTCLLQHRQETLARSKQNSIVVLQDHTPSAHVSTREVSPPTTAVLATPTLHAPSSLLTISSSSSSSSGGRRSVYIPSHESGDLSDAGDQQRQRSSTLPRRQPPPPPPPKRDEKYTLSPSPSRGGSPRNSMYEEKGTALDPSLATPITTPPTTTTKAQSGPSLTTPASPSRGVQSSSCPLLSKRSAADQSKLASSEGDKGGKGEGGGGSDDKVAAMLSSFCDDLTISMDEEIKSLDSGSGSGSPFHAPGSPFRARTLSNPRSSPFRRASNPVVVEPLLPPVLGVNEAAFVERTAMPPVVTPLVVTPTTTSTVMTVTVTSSLVATPSGTPTTTGSASLPLSVASTKSPDAVVAPSLPPVAPPTLRTQFTDLEAGKLVEVVRVGSPFRRASNPVVVEPLLPPVLGVNEAAFVEWTAMPPVVTPPVVTPLVVTPTTTSTVMTVTMTSSLVDTPSGTPTTTGSASLPPSVASTKSPDAVVAPSLPPVAPPTLRTQFTDLEAGELVEVVRVGTAMNYKNTLTAVNGVLDFIKTKVPECSDMVEGLLRALQSSQTSVSTASSDQLVSRDMERIRDAFFMIKDCKDDTQQRGWAVHDDHHIISGYLSELLQLLCDADPDISRRVVKEDKYENVLTLIEFYHLEPRIPLRLLMLKIFAQLCELDHTIIGILLSSVLPNELGRDMQQGIAETEKALYSSTVCTIIFSTGEALPLSVYDQWNQDYILFLLDTIEQPPSSDKQDRLPDAFMNVVLAYNQHFQDPASNIVMSALKMRPNPKAFSEKLMMLVNRGEDPVAGHCEPNALLKITLDMFSDKATSSIFYTTDLMVLIDIIHRQLSDLEAGSKTRTHYLELLYRVLSTTEYTEHNRRQRELTTCLSRIAREDYEESERDKQLVARIHTAFPLLFEDSTVI